MQRYPTQSLSPIEMLEFLMKEHDLGQSDLPEIGSQSLISKILKKERHLTVEPYATLNSICFKSALGAYAFICNISMPTTCF